MPILFKEGYISRRDLQLNREHIFVFGDNCMRKGLGGQAKEMRGEPNAIGICTKKKPARTEDSFFTDEEYDRNCVIILADIEKLKEYLDEGYTVIIPKNGIGTGLSKLDEKAPRTFKFLNTALEDLYYKYMFT